MSSTTAQLTQAPPPSATPRPIASRRRFPSRDRPTLGEVFDERAPLIGAPAFFGPPIIFVLGPWLLLVLLLTGPVALVLTALLVLALGAGLLVVCAAVIASPYLLMRHLHAYRLLDAKPGASLHLFRKYRAGSGRHGSLQPKGVS